MKILIAGDLCITENFFSEKLMDQSIINLFNSSDYNIVNLEAPVTKNKTKIIKTGPHIKSNKELTLYVLKSLKIDLVTLANNHIKDFDEQGVIDTVNFCMENGISTVGAGVNSHEASEIFYLTRKDYKIAIINIAENEWASATDNSAGANGMNIIDDIIKIQEAKRTSDFVFVIVHGGHEYYNLPSPRMQKQYRFYAEQGADIVVGHHTHCISGYETWKGVPIYYSLGNFLFTKDSQCHDWYKGLILEIDLTANRVISKLHPIMQTKGNFKLDLLQGNEKKEIETRINKYSAIILDDKLLEQAWEQYVSTMSKSYLDYWSPLSFVSNRYLSAFLRRLPLKFTNKKGYALYLNLMRCEAHRDLSREVIQNYLKR